MTWDGKTCCYPGDESMATKNESEFNYCKLLNKVLPYDIRVYAWAPVPNDFSARFDCGQRIYHYILPTRSSHHTTQGENPTIDLDRMKRAAEKLCGFHDFRNYCRMDVANGVTDYNRTLTSIQFFPLKHDGRPSETGSAYDFLMVELGAPSFLWHQVRCLVAVLAMIGAGREEVFLIDQLFDTDPSKSGSGDKGKPNYKMAPDYPLVLWDCAYDSLDWKYDGAQLDSIITNLKELWIRYSIKTLVIKSIIDDLSNIAATQEVQKADQQGGSRTLIYDCFRADSFSEFLPQINSQPNTHRKLMTRQCGLSLEEKLNVKNIKAKIKPTKSMSTMGSTTIV